jgi:uncharacterized membrane protein YkgB
MSDCEYTKHVTVVSPYISFYYEDTKHVTVVSPYISFYYEDTKHVTVASLNCLSCYIYLQH